MYLDGRLKLRVTLPEIVADDAYVVETEPCSHDGRVVEGLSVSFGYPAPDHSRALALGIDDRSVVLGRDAQSQLLWLLLQSLGKDGILHHKSTTPKGG